MKILRAIIAMLPLLILVSVASGVKSVKDFLSVCSVIVICFIIIGLFFWGQLLYVPVVVVQDITM